MKTWFAHNNGSIFSLKNGRYGVRPIAGQLTPQLTPGGYIQVSLNGKNKLAHRLVWDHFNGPIPKDLEINHIDGNKKNNYLSNLELVTPSENQLHSYKLGLAHSNSIIQKVQCIETGEIFQSQREAARKYGCNEQLISAVVLGRQKTTRGYTFKRISP